MGKHSRRSNFARNAAVVSATVAGVTALTVPTAAANPIANLVPGGDIVGQFVPGNLGAGNLLDSPQVPGLSQITDLVGAQGSTPSFSGNNGIVAAARSQIGTPYVWGGTQPGGFDCSGLTQWAYSQVGKAIPRTSQQQAASGSPVAYASKLPGDIISFYSGATHVGIYSGGENVIHAPQTGDVVKEAPISYMPVNNVVRF